MFADLRLAGVSDIPSLGAYWVSEVLEGWSGRRQRSNQEAAKGPADLGSRAQQCRGRAQSPSWPELILSA